MKTTRKTMIFAMIAAISVASTFAVVAANASTITTTVLRQSEPATIEALGVVSVAITHDIFAAGINPGSTSGPGHSTGQGSSIGIGHSQR